MWRAKALELSDINEANYSVSISIGGNLSSFNILKRDIKGLINKHGQLVTPLDPKLIYQFNCDIFQPISSKY
jgi:hypothetical protein